MSKFEQFGTLNLSRRRLLQSAAGGVAALALTGLPGQAAAAGSIVVSNWGGDWNDRTIRYVEKPLLEDKGFSIVRDLGMEPERKAKLIAEKRIRRSSVDVIHINSSDAFELKQQDAVIDLDVSKIPNYANVVPELKTGYFLPWLYSGVVIITTRTRSRSRQNPTLNFGTRSGQAESVSRTSSTSTT